MISKKYYINSVNGDYIEETDNNGVASIVLVTRSRRILSDDGSRIIDYIPGVSISLTAGQFSKIKGFIPVKYKNLHKNRSTNPSVRTVVPGTDEARDLIIGDILKK